MVGAAELAAKELEVKDEDEAVEAADVTDPTILPGLGGLVVEAMWNVREAMYRVCLFQNGDSGEVVD